MRAWPLICALILFAGTAHAGAPRERIVDLTHPFSNETIYWPTADGFRLKVEAAGKTEKGFYYSANSFCADEHGGTHLDAPIHFAEGMPTVDEIPLDRLVAPGVLVDVSRRVGEDPDSLVSVDDLEAWEKQHGRIPDRVIVLLRTGWGERYSDRKRYLGTAKRGAEAVPELRFPGLAPAAARWLAEERSVAAVGIDTASIDRGRSELFESHVILAGAGIPGFENLASLEQLPARGFRIVALPMKIQGGSGGPLRIVALVEPDTSMPAKP
jgi:kynurenine formamidase